VDKFIDLFGVMMAVMVPVGIGGGVFVLIAAYTKKFKPRRVASSSAEVEQLRARIEELEQGQKQLHELAERVDFVERMLPALREGKPANS